MVADACSGVGLEDVEILADRLWRYNIRFSAGQLRSGVPGAIDRAQGEANVWYAGGSLSHWNIDSITDASQRFTRRFARAIGAPIDVQLRLLRMDGMLRDL
jgi:hypothetical protein